MRSPSQVLTPWYAVGAKQQAHCATFPGAVLRVLREYVPRGVVLDVFGGTGRVGLLGRSWVAVSLELEPEWARQGPKNGCALSIVADATALPFRARSIPAIATSPAYGNRMADGYAGSGGRSDATRTTYRLSLGRPLSQGSGASLQWGPAYRDLHSAAWEECARVLQLGGVLVVNMKNHVRKGVIQEVCLWHWRVLAALGFVLENVTRVPLRGDANTVRMRMQGRKTVDFEEVTKWRLGRIA